MSRIKPLSRRTFLYGSGAAMSLPFLEAMIGPTRSAFGATSGPKRIVYVTFAAGADMPNWIPAATGANYVLPSGLAPLASLKNDFIVASGLDLNVIKSDATGDSSHRSSSFLTCMQPFFKGSAPNSAGGPTIDYLIADAIGAETRLKSLVIGNDNSSESSLNRYSWVNATTPQEFDFDPSRIFDNIFMGVNAGTDPAALAATAQRQKNDLSVLDFVMDDSKRLSNRLGTADKKTMDEYLTGVRELEQRIVAFDRSSSNVCTPGARPPSNVVYEQKVALMYDLIHRALQCDITRVVNYGLAREIPRNTYGFLGEDFAREHHETSHDSVALTNGIYRDIVKWQVARLAEFLVKMKASTEGSGSMLDNSIVVFGSSVAHSNRHSHWDLPILVAGRGQGAIAPGKHLRFSSAAPYYMDGRPDGTLALSGTRLANLHLTLAQAMGLNIAKFADSTGTVNLT